MRGPAALTWSEQYSQEATSGLTLAERDALKVYTSNQYRTINRTLRFSDVPGRNTTIGRTVAEIDSALERSVIPRDVVVGRTFNGGFLQGEIAAGNLKVGSTISDRAFVSTSTAINSSPSAAVMIIKVPKGSRGLALQHISNYPEERELLLPRGSTFKVTKITHRQSEHSTLQGVVLEARLVKGAH